MQHFHTAIGLAADLFLPALDFLFDFWFFVLPALIAGSYVVVHLAARVPA